MPKTSYVYKCFEEAFKALTDKLKPMMHELGFFVMLASSFQASCASQSPDLGKQCSVPCKRYHADKKSNSYSLSFRSAAVERKPNDCVIKTPP